MLRHVMAQLRSRRRSRSARSRDFQRPTRAGSGARASNSSSGACSIPERCSIEFLDRKTVGELVNEHIEGRQNLRLLVWSLLNFEGWLERFHQ